MVRGINTGLVKPTDSGLINVELLQALTSRANLREKQSLSWSLVKCAINSQLAGKPVIPTSIWLHLLFLTDEPRGSRVKRVITTTALISLISLPVHAAEQWLHLFFPADNEVQQSFVRINNRSEESGSVTITAIDDEGVTASSTVSISFSPGQSRNFNSDDLEQGNVNKGLTGAIGSGTGNWRLKFESELDLDIMGLFRNNAGFVNIVHTSATDVGDTTHQVYFMNPGSNVNRQSRLRIVNLTNNANAVSVSAIDDSGNSAGPVTFSIAASKVKEVTTTDLESGGAGLTGSLGDGAGKWRMTVTTSGAAEVLSLLEDPDGNVSNLSTAIVPEDDAYLINYFLSGEASQQGFIRFINNSNSAATINIEGTDEIGNSGNVSLSLGALEAKHLNTDDLESGNTNKGLTGSLGDGEGAWRLSMTADQDVDIVGLFRTTDGFVNVVHDNTNYVATTTHFVPFFNPASNANQVSTLRLNNPGNQSNTFSIVGTDDDGVDGMDPYEITLSGGDSTGLTAAELETVWGDGAGKWRIAITSTRDSYAQSLLTAPGDLLSNLSVARELPGSETNARTESWMINNSERSNYIVDSNSDKALVNVQSVSETTINQNAFVKVDATGVPNYTHVLTQDEVDWLNNRPNAASDFRNGNQTTASAGPVDFGEDINYKSSTQGCEVGEGLGFWPPGPVCPQDVAHEAYFASAPTLAEEGAECEPGLDTIGLWVNGVSVYGYSDGMSYNSEGVWMNLAPSFEAYDIDVCHGHAANNDYHHHSYPHCLAEQLGDDGTAHSPVYGFMQDGYPIYGPYESNGQLARSCWVARNYAGSTAEGGCNDGTRSCQLVDNTDPLQGTTNTGAGPGLSETVSTVSGNSIVAASGVYFEDYYFDADCAAQGGAALDEHNGHDTEDGRGYHYHVTVTDDSENKTLGINYLPTFPFFVGPALYGDVETSGTDWRCTSANSGGGMPPMM